MYEDANLGLRPSLCLFYLITQALFIFTPSHLAISQIDDVSNWKAWNILEQRIQRSSHTFTSLGWVPNGKKKRKNGWSLFWKRNKGASFGMVLAVLVVSWLSISHSLS